MFRGEAINVTEKRAVLHVALRAPEGEEIFADGVNVVPLAHAELDKMAVFSNSLRSGEWKGQGHYRRHGTKSLRGLRPGRSRLRSSLTALRLGWIPKRHGGTRSFAARYM